MRATIKKLLDKYREQWRYLVVGCGTTCVNYLIYLVLNLLGVFYLVSNIIAWVGAVTFAYFALSYWVYPDTSKRGIREAGSFALSRLFSLGLETLLLFLLVDLGHLNENITKLFLNVVVIVVNYLTGRIVYHAGRKAK